MKKQQLTVTLSSLLQRRGMTLEQFISEFFVNSHEDLLAVCHKLSVIPPSKQDVEKFFAPKETFKPEVIAVAEANDKEVRRNVLKLVKKKVVKIHDSTFDQAQNDTNLVDSQRDPA